jgi:hypothetical protein
MKPLLILLTLCGCVMTAHAAGARRGGPTNRDLMSINISHPFIFSVTSGQLVDNIVSEVEIGLGGAKIAIGLGSIEQQSFIAVKACIMYKWEEPFGNQLDMSDIIDQVDFPNHRFYYGSEAVLSSKGYRLAIGAYRIYDPEDGDTEDTLVGASIGLGF